jgi:hypothetical protein
MSQKRISISIGEAYQIYKNNLSMKPTDCAEKLLLSLGIIENFMTEDQQLSFENAQDTVRKRLTKLVSDVKQKKWRKIEKEDTFFSLQVITTFFKFHPKLK